MEAWCRVQGGLERPFFHILVATCLEDYENPWALLRGEGRSKSPFVVGRTNALTKALRTPYIVDFSNFNSDVGFIFAEPWNNPTKDKCARTQ